MPLNESNFLMWFRPGESQYTQLQPRPFVREPEALSPVLWWVIGETMQFYVNSTDNTPFQNAITLEHERSGNFGHFTVHSLSQIDFPNGRHTFGFVAAPELPEGFVRLHCGPFTSQWIWLTTAEKAAQFTAVVRFRNSRRLQNLRYGYLPTDWTQKFRIRLAVKSEESAHSKEVYTESTTGKRRHSYSEPAWLKTFITPEYDRWGHRAWSSLIEHDYIEINGQVFTYEGPYKANMTEGDSLSTGEVILRDEPYSTLHRA